MRKITLHKHVFATLILVLLFVAGNTFHADGQIRISENFDANPYPQGWVFTGANTQLGVPGCAGNAVRKYFNTASASMVTANYEAQSNGTNLTVNFDYKVVNHYAPNAIVGTGWGNITAEYSVNNGTSWNLAFTVNDANHLASLDCATKTFVIQGANLPVGGDIKLRFTSNSGQFLNYYIYIDNIYAIQELPLYSGTPTMGAITSSSNTVSGSQDATVLSIPEAQVSGVTFQWESSLDNATFTPIPGATKSSLYVTGLSANTWYRCTGTCTANNSSATSMSKEIAVVHGQPAYTVSRTIGNTFNSIFCTGNSILITNHVSPGIELGFGFNFMNKIYSVLQVSRRGYITFTPNLPPSGYNDALNNISDINNFPLPLVAPFWENAVSAEEVKYLISGTAPNRKIIVEWKNARLSSLPSPSLNLNYQVILYEGSNIIEFAYGDMDGHRRVTTGVSTFTYIDYSYTVGLRNAATNYVNEHVANTDYFSTSAQQNILKILPDCNSNIIFTPSASFVSGVAPVAVAPVNDNSSAAIPLPINSGPCESLCGSYYSSANATPSPESSSCNPLPDDDVWFTINVTNASPFNIRVVGANSYTPIVSLLDATFATVGSYGCINARLTENIAVASLNPGLYYIRVHAAGAGSGDVGRFGICVSTPPANDVCSSAIPLLPTNGFPTNPTSGNLEGATPSVTVPIGVSCTVGGDNNDVWYAVTIPATGNLVVQMDAVDEGSSNFNLQALIGSCANPISIACNSNGNFISGSPGITMPKIALTGQLPGSIVLLRVRKNGTNSRFLISAYDTTSTICPVISGGNACMVENETIISAVNKNLYKWTPIVNTNGEIIAEIFPNGKTLGRLTTKVNVNTGALRQGTPGFYLDRNYTVTAEIPPASGTVSEQVRIRLYLKQSELDDLIAANSGTASNLKVLKNNDLCGNVMVGNTAELNTTTANYVNGHYAEVSVPSFSSFYMITTSPLPVYLLNFSGYRNGSVNQLTWTTSEETNFSHFELQRAADGKKFSNLAIVNKKQDNQYPYTDEKPLPAKNYYRLKMVDIDGSETVSDVIVIENLYDNQLLNAYPNPFTTRLNIEIPGQISATAHVNIKDVYGRTVKMLSVTQQNMSVDVNELSPGVYIIQVWNGDNFYSEKLIKY